jgi:hypothetical protein
VSVEVVIVILGMVLSAGIAWGISQKGQQSLTEEIKNAWGEISKLRDWRHSHDLESSNARRELEREDGKIREMILSRDSKLDVIISRLETIDAKIDKIETREET